MIGEIGAIVNRINFADFTTLAVLVLGVLILIASIAAIYMRNIVSAIITSGLVSLLSSILYVLLSAPDVAMTEAAIGSALTTVVFLYAVSKVKPEDRKELNDD